MPQVPCPNCHAELRLPDAAAGRQVRCPACQTVFQAPAERPEAARSQEWDPPTAPTAPLPGGAAAPPDFGPPPAGGFGPAPENPYSSPSDVTPYSTPQAEGIGPRGIRTADLGEIFASGWQTMTTNIAPFLVAGIVLFTVQFVSQFVQQIIGTIGQAIGAQQGAAAAGAIMVVLVFAATIATMLLQLFLMVGVFKMALSACRGELVAPGLIFSGGDRFLPALGAMLLIGLLALVAMIPGFLLIGAGIALGGNELSLIGPLILVPYVLLVAFAVNAIFFPMMFGVVEGRQSVLQALGTGWSVLSANLLNALVLAIVSVGLAIGGTLACCVGQIFTTPLTFCFWAAAYLLMTGQGAAHLPTRPAPQPTY